MRLLATFFFFALLLSACKDEPERIPAYIRIEPFAVDAAGGAGWQKITDAWVYVNDRFLGGYSLPAMVPVLDEGEGDILIFPGVKENGLLQTPGVYPFLERYEGKTMLEPGQTATVQPVTRYLPEAIFPWTVERASFNVTTIVLEDRDGDPSTTFELTTDGAFEGRSVKLTVDTIHSLNEIATEQVENLPSTGARAVWLEMHYRNDLPFELWLLGTEGSSANEVAQPIYQFSTSENWNKIYFNLTEFLVASQQDKYRLFVRVALQRNVSGKFEQQTGAVFLDNLRLIHF
ncbi:MAG: hypothetical protein IPM98_14510 [Lewinellaceae bacterium]|nr:hypothetical protein [Lewinellaceae bacterium]